MEEQKSSISLATLGLSEEILKALKDKGYDIQTRLTAASHFYVAESYHQEYYARAGRMPYCHIYTKRF